MKRLIVLLAFFLGASNAWSADSCSPGVATELGENTGVWEIVINCTADATGNFEATLDTTTMEDLSGRHIKMFSSYGNTVAELAEIEIRDSRGKIFLDNDNNGNNFLSKVNFVDRYPEGPNSDDYQIANGNYPWTIYAENIGAAGGTIRVIVTAVENR